MMKRGLLLLSLLGVLAPHCARAEAIVADISSRRIAVTTGFTGATTTLFGSLPEAGDVVIVVRGPSTDVVVRKKQHVMGVWLNGPEVRFAQVPGFYWVASSRPLTDIASAGFLEGRRIGISHQRYTIADATNLDDAVAFQSALIELRQQDQTFMVDSAQKVTILENRLYRADLFLPADAPTGDYQVTTYLLKDGQLIDAQQVPLSLRKVGAMDKLSDIAQDQSALYALGAIGLALMAGWLSATLMQRR